MKLPIAAVTICAALAACGGDDEPVAPVDAAPEPDAVVVPPDAAPPDAATAARVDVTIEYAGAATGTLLAAAFSSFPPQGGPMAFAQDATPAYPQVLALEGLPASTIYILGFLDLAPASPTQPGPEDLTAWSEAITLVEGQSATITLTLEDP